MKKDPMKSKTTRLLAKINSPEQTKGDLKASAMETFKSILVGVLAGGVAGAIAGRASLGIGALVNGIGHYTGNSIASMVGLGMMTSSLTSKANQITSNRSFSELAKERVNDFSQGVKHKLFMDRKTEKKLQEIEQESKTYLSEEEISKEAKLSGVDPNVILDNMERDLEQAAQFYADSTEDLESDDTFDDFEEVTDIESGQDDSNDDSDNDLEGLEEDHPIF